MPGVKLRPPAMPRQQSRLAVGTIAVAAGALLVLWLLSSALALPSFVSRVTLTNTTPFQVRVEVQGSGGDDGWLDLGAVDPNGSEPVDEVVDQGSTWTFRFSSAGVFAGELELSRSELSRDHWVLTIPPGTSAPLEAAGLSPSTH